MVIIKSKNFTLRPFKKGDAKSIARNINNKKIYRNTLHIPYPYTLKDANEFLAKILREAKKKKPSKVNFAIDIDGKVIGSVSLEKIEGHKSEIGYWLGERFWSRGIMSQAVKMVTDFGFYKLKLKRIYAHVFPFNKTSMQILKRNGYRFEGILRKNSKKDNKFIDDYLFAKVRL
jgi:RimJ/RimL family protein N-acetyltransferase